MTRYVEDLIRQAQRRQAARAVSPDRILAALPARAASRSRHRRGGVMAATAVAALVAAAVTVPVLALKGGGAGGTDNAGGTADGSAAQGAPPVTAAGGATDLSELIPVALRYRPTWLPPGVRERSRLASLDRTQDPDATVLRIWTLAPIGGSGEAKGARLGMTIRHTQDTKDPQANTGKQVDLSGRPGFYHGAPEGESKSYVEWRIDAETVVSIDQVNLRLSEQDMLRVARSVRPDPASLDIPLRFGTLPDALYLQTAEFTGDSRTSWQVQVFAEKTVATTGSTTGSPEAGGGKATNDSESTKDSKSTKDAAKAAEDEKATKEAPDGPDLGDAAKRDAIGQKTASNRFLSVSLGTSTTAPHGGTTLTVGGHPARIVKDTSDQLPDVRYLVVDLGQGRLLTLRGSSLTQQDLVTTAEHIEIDATPDLSWLGAR